MTENLPARQDDQPIIPRQAATDAQLIALWLHGRSINTQQAYEADVRRFLDHVGKPLHQITLGDLQAYADKLEADQLAPASRCRKLAAIKSLFAFGHKIGYLQFDVGRAVRIPGVRDTLSERILTEVEITRMIALEAQPRNHAILLCLYGSGIRVSELCGLRWRDCVDRADGGQITVMGKRDKTRTILLPSSVWSVIIGLRGEAADGDPVFKSRQGGSLTRSQVWRIVRRAARRAGIKKNVSPHFCRHAHGSHALDHGAPISLVQATLGHASVATTGRYLHARPGDSSSKYLPL